MCPSPRFGEHEAHARGILQATLDAIDPHDLARERWPEDVEPVGNGRVALVAIGKASLGMAAGSLERLERVDAGVVIGPRGATPKASRLATLDRHGVPFLAADHPVPTERNVRAARHVERIAADLGADDRLVLCISGGGSAHLTLPAEGVALHDLADVTRHLSRAGADIEALNTVRKHVERLKGGRLARLAAPAHVLAIVMSDVVGDSLSTIASGPVTPDASTFADALAILDGHDAREIAPTVTRFLEQGAAGDQEDTPESGDPCFGRVETRVIASHVDAVRAAARAAESLGFHVLSTETHVTGSAAEAGRDLARRALDDHGEPARPSARVLGGETTVEARSADGTGGPAQELALAGALILAGNTGAAMVSFATDGVDGPTSAAGALVTGETVDHLRGAGVDPALALTAHDSHAALGAVGALLETGPTGTNLNDVAIVLRYSVEGGSLETGI